MCTRFRPARAMVLIAIGALFAAGCDDRVPPDPDPVVLADGGAAVPLEMRLWQPPAPFEGPCPEGSLVTPGGCSETWVCPLTWQRVANGFGCRPPALPDCRAGSVPLPDGTCLSPWPCPDGWALDPDGACVPPTADCPDSAPVPGGCLPPPDCARQAPDGALWINADAEAGGDGSPQRPFATLEAGFAAGADRFALAAGRHLWPEGPVPGYAAVWGACPAQVELLGVTVTDDLDLDGVHLVGHEQRPALVVEGGAAQLVGVRASGSAPVLRVSGGRLHLDESRVGPGGRGLVVSAGEVIVRRVTFSDLSGQAVRVEADGVAELDRIRAERTFGVLSSGRLTGADLTLVQSEGQGLGAAEGAVVQVERVAMTWPEGPLGSGILSIGGALTARDVTIIGALGAGVTAENPAADVQLERAWIGRVTAGDGPNWGVGASFGGRLRLTDVRIDRSQPPGLVAIGEVSASGLRLTDPDTVDRVGAAITALDGGRLLGSRIAWSAATGFGLWAGADGTVEVQVAHGRMPDGPAVAGAQAGTLRLTDAVLDGGGTAVVDAGGSSIDSGMPGAQPTTFEGRRISVQAGPATVGVLGCRARVELADAVIDGGDDGLRLAGSTSSLARLMLGGAVNRSLATSLDIEGEGCANRGGEPPEIPGRTDLTFAAVDGSTIGLVAHAGGRFIGADIAIGATTAPASSGAYSGAGGAVELDRVRVRSSVGLAADGGMLTARSAHVAGPGSPLPEIQSPGALTQRDGTLVLEDVRVVEATGIAVGAMGGQLVASDLRVEGTRSLPSGSGGAGVSVADGAIARLERFHLVDNRAFGLTAHDAELTLIDGVVEETAPDSGAEGPQRGIGVGLTGGAVVDIAGLVVRDNHTVGLTAGPAELTAERLWVQGTRPAYPGGPARGVSIEAPSTAGITDFVVRDHPGPGVVVSGAKLTLTDGRIEGNDVGLLVRNASDVITDRVLFAENGVDESCEAGCIDAPAPVEDP